MASITLAEAQKLSLDDLVLGVIENIVEINPIYRVLPFQDIMGNAKTYNRENALGNAEFIGIDATIAAKAAATYSKITTNLTTIVGDAEVNGLLQSQHVGGDIAASQIASKAKQVGRMYQFGMFEGVVNGFTTTPAGYVFPTARAFAKDNDEFDGLRKIIQVDFPASQEITSVAALKLEELDTMLHAVKSKDGQVDAIVSSARTIRAFRSLMRGLGAGSPEYVEVAGVNMPSYAGIPWFRSDWIPEDIDNSAGTGTATDTYVIAMNFDDGSEKVGVSGLTAYENMGVHVQVVGPAETKDNDIYRVKFYSSLAVYSALSAAILNEVAA